MNYRGVTLTLLSIKLAFLLFCFMSFVSANTTFVGTYSLTAYVLDLPSSIDYASTRTNGGNIQTYYGIYTNTSLWMKSDMEFTGTYEGSPASMRWEDWEEYYDAYERLVLHTVRSELKVDGYVESWSGRDELGNYVGYYPTPNDIIKADINDQWNYTYERRAYKNGKYEETHTYEVEIVVKDFPTKVVEAGTFSTVRVEAVEWKDEVLNSKCVKWRKLSDGKLIAHESYELEDGEWNLLMIRELKSEVESIKTSTNGLPIAVIAGIAVVAVCLVSFLAYIFLKRRKNACT